MEVSPGYIEANVQAKGKTIKLKKLNAEIFEMVVVVNSSKQTFRIYGKNQTEIETVIQTLRSTG